LCGDRQNKKEGSADETELKQAEVITVHSSPVPVVKWSDEQNA
jgi:hypothetical protein